MNSRSCRFCEAELRCTFADLGMTPLSNSYLRPEQFNQQEVYYPLVAYVCESCFLVQLEVFETPDKIFSEYAYLSSYSSTWLEHCRAYVQGVSDKLGLNEGSSVIEIGSNDGALLQYFVERGIPVLGIDPAANVAVAAEKRGVSTRVQFFGRKAAEELVGEDKRADLIIGNNVLAHIPELNDFVSGLKVLLRPSGVITMEFPHIMRLIEFNQFDTIYHEHFSYFSLNTVEKVFNAHGMTVFDVTELPTHGGSLRIYVKHAENDRISVSNGVHFLKCRERTFGLDTMSTYLDFNERVKQIKRNILSSLISLKNQRKTIVGYGAPAKGNTLLNYCGIGTDFIEYTVDRSRYKQGLFLPGSHIPIYDPDMIERTRPDYVVIFPWNIKDEIVDQLSYVSKWGGKFLVFIPEVQIEDSVRYRNAH